MTVMEQGITTMTIGQATLGLLLLAFGCYKTRKKRTDPSSK